ncbi:MAG TPA: hypothetical protein VIJ38_10405 [Acidobacteriaceae bacterium]
MIAHTKAFVTYRNLSQGHLNFVVLVCHAVPALQADLLLPAATFTNPPDHFKATRNAKSDVGQYISSYKNELARITVEAIFSYFEAYVKDALVEVVAFHGGEAEFKKLSLKRNAKFLTKPSSDIQAHWSAPGFEDTELGVFMEPEVSHGETKIYARVQA